MSKAERKHHAAIERANRLRELRPDIGNIRGRLTVEEAVKLGGYESADMMDKDLARIAKTTSL
jgi:hypothetical protein